jgi:hypothetical protein
LCYKSHCKQWIREYRITTPKETELVSWKLLVSSSPTNQHVPLFDMSFCFKTPYLIFIFLSVFFILSFLHLLTCVHTVCATPPIFIFNSLTFYSWPTALQLMPEWNWSKTPIFSAKHITALWLRIADNKLGASGLCL